MLITDSKALKANITKFGKRAKSFTQQAHIYGLSALWHAAKHRNAELLNQHREALPDYLRPAWSRYLRDVLNVSEWLTLKGGVFSVKKGTVEKTEAFATWLEQKAESLPLFTVKAEKREEEFGLEAIDSRLKNLLKRIKDEQPEHLPQDAFEHLIAARQAIAAELARQASRPN